MVKKKKKEKKQNFFFHTINKLNQSKLFAGIIYVLLNIVSKHVSLSLSDSQEGFLKWAIGQQLLVFAMSWLGTRDIITALILTAVFTVLTQYLFNETSMFFIVPKQWNKFDNHLDLDDDGVVEEHELEEALKHLSKAKEAHKKKANNEKINKAKKQ